MTDSTTLAMGYTVRRLLPEDAAGVTECVRRVYGDSYAHAAIYHPEQIIRLNDTGELVSVVALESGGQVVGHYALERPGLGVVAEEGEAMVLPEHRHEHLMEGMRGLLGQEAHRLGLIGLFGRAVTNHVFTQRVHDRFNLRPCALSLGELSRSFHNMAEPLPQRMSLLLGFKYLRTPTQVMVHIPAHHRDMGARIYDQFQVPLEFQEPSRAEGLGQVVVDAVLEQQQATIRVLRVGADTAADIGQARRKLCEQSQAEAIFLELPLAQSGTPELCEAVEHDGFFFSGIGPSFSADGDVLRLQWLGVQLDMALLQIENSFAKELVAYVASERERVRGLVGSGPPKR